MKLFIRDNYFKDPKEIRQLALSVDNYRVDNELRMPPTGWRGQRSLPLSFLNNKKLDKYEKEIFETCYDFFDLKDFTYISAPPEYKKPESEFTITSYFHITTEETRASYFDWQDRFHKDSNTAVAGVVYLNVNPPQNSGTSIFDVNINQFINVENQYNRLIAYDGSRVHAVSDVFGTSKETGRLTFTFFIHEKNFTEYFKC